MNEIVASKIKEIEKFCNMNLSHYTFTSEDDRSWAAYILYQSSESIYATKHNYILIYNDGSLKKSCNYWSSKRTNEISARDAAKIIKTHLKMNNFK